MINKREMGTGGEAIAADFLEKNGLKMIDMNYRNRYGEIDIVAKDTDSLVFVEVKLRKDDSAGHPLEAVNKNKQRIIRNVAAHFMYNKGYGEDTVCRFDVVGIIKDGAGEPEIFWVKDAF